MRKIITLFLTAVVVLTVTSCQKTQTADTSTAMDREGNPIVLPTKIDRIISLGPSNTEILIALGFADKIIAADAYSRGIEGLATDVPLFNMLAPDGEQIILLEPDVIFVTAMSKAGGANPFKLVSDAGICVIYIPTCSSIADIQSDIRFIAKVVDAVEKGDEIVANMEQTIDAIAKIGETVTDKKTVYFEISAESYSLYSFGRGVFLNEMLEIIGANNILADRNKWVTVAEEVILDRNPDVILTNADDIVASVERIMSRPGWNTLTAVQNGAVYSIDADTSSRPSHHIVKALMEMAKAVYPDKY
ncbi:MAG: ABC transporter substrate-binding protein [Planctomycetaceae bacterium]|nr:ABC transporter substrate-binding protein [Planctomycetaceae bacterium]